MGSAKTRELSSLETRRVAINSSGRFWTRSRRNLHTHKTQKEHFKRGLAKIWCSESFILCNRVCKKTVVIIYLQYNIIILSTIQTVNTVLRELHVTKLLKVWTALEKFPLIVVLHEHTVLITNRHPE